MIRFVECCEGLTPQWSAGLAGGVQHGIVRDNADELPLAERQLIGYLSHRRSCTTPTQPQEKSRDSAGA